MNLFGITLSDSDVWLLSVAGALFTALVVHWLSASRAKHARTLAARDKFHASFSDTLAVLRNTIDNPCTILERQFSQQESAVIEFAAHLDKKKREQFFGAWRKYYCHDKTNIRFLEQYSSTGVSISQVRNNRTIAIQRIEHLLTFANQT